MEESQQVYNIIIINVNVGNWEMECLRDNITVGLHQKFQEYKISALAQNKETVFWTVAVAPYSSADV